MALALAATAVWLGCQEPFRPPHEQVVEAHAEVRAECVPAPGVSWRFCRIPAGWVVTGGGRSPYPKKRFEIEEFWLADTTVTNLDYELFDPSHPRPALSRLDRSPVTEVSWHDAMEYAEWLSERLGVELRLPLTWEWQYACLAGQQGPYPWGPMKRGFGNRARRLANYANPEGAVAVGSYPPNGFGLYDMAGNVREWAHDTMAYRDEGEDHQPPAQSTLKALKNCPSSNASQLFCECNWVSANRPEARLALHGFRLRASGPPPATPPAPTEPSAPR